jgi:hypothetical protein
VKPSTFRFANLPKDLMVYCLKIMLVAPDGIINPWLPKGEQEEHFPYYGPPIIYEKAWAKLLLPSILATCQEIHEIDTPMLYGYNTFRFVNSLVETAACTCPT